MYVWYWMTKKIFTVCPDDYLSDAIGLMKEHNIKHLPVLKNDKLKGLISDRDVRQYTPSKATSLDMYELHYILSNTRIKELMTAKVVTTGPDTPLEEAAMIMLDNNIGCLPIVDDGKVVGIISDNDIFRALVDITGVRHGGNRIYVTLEDRPGSIRELADIIRKDGFHLQSILTSYEGVREGYRSVVIRTAGNGNLKGMKEDLEAAYKNVQIRKG
jgi:acetoin utilization protein AcuB